ncbi:hypothetical protein ACFQ07_33795 [Actinomadura adrarensis]|uniref:Uncharacterized protein n=1 Tax=Actinomadura adrarensis TaxID=1819600 RepID=A0ABW3CRP1_9ACTN
MTFREYALRPGASGLEAPSAAWNPALSKELDLEQAVELLQRRYPDLSIYWGEYTGSLWAVLPDRLVEAKTAFDLARRLDATLERPNTQSARARYVRPEIPAPRATDGTLTMQERRAAPTASQPPDTCSPSRRRRSGFVRRFLAGCRRN